MKKIMKCNICDSVMGSIEKDEITKEDESNYRLSTMCENGHKECVLEEQTNQEVE